MDDLHQDLSRRMEKDMDEMVSKTALAGQLLSHMGNTDSIAVLTAADGGFARLLAGLVTDATKSDGIFSVIAVQGEGGLSIVGERPNGQQEPLAGKRGPLILIIPQETVQYVKNVPAIWKRVIAVDTPPSAGRGASGPRKPGLLARITGLFRRK